MIPYTERQQGWVTPNGNPCTFIYREGTNDWNTLNACLGTNDEYKLAGREIVGDVLDVGGYLGSVGVPVAIDNPEARVVIVEPVPWNADLIRRHAVMNGVADRVTVFEGACGPKGVTTSEIRFGYVGDANLEHHAFVGNTSLAYDNGGDTPHEVAEVETLGLAEVLDRFGIKTAAYAKIDCEGGEWTFLDAPAAQLKRLPYIVGEAHAVRGHRGRDIVGMLKATHRVELSGEPDGTCGFTATLR